MSWQRVVTWVIAVVAGAVYGTAGTVAHAYRLGVLPVGLIVAIVGCAAILLAVRALSSDRWAALACGVGMLGATVLFSGTGPGGSVIVPGGSLDALGPVNLGIVWTVAVVVLGLAAVTWPDISGSRRRADN